MDFTDKQVMASYNDPDDKPTARSLLHTVTIYFNKRLVIVIKML